MWLQSRLRITVSISLASVFGENVRGSSLRGCQIGLLFVLLLLPPKGILAVNVLKEL